MEAKTILSFGEALWDLMPTGAQLGGAPLNLAYRLTELGDRGVVVTRFGRDEFGRVGALRIAELGMDPGYVQWDNDRPTGTVNVRVDAQGNPDFTITPDVAYDCIEVTYELLQLAQRADAIAFGTLALRTEKPATTLQRILSVSGGKPRFLDLNLRKQCFTWPCIQETLGQATLLKLNADEARQLAFGLDLPDEPLPQFCDAVLQRCCLAAVLVTLGCHGAFATAADGTRAYDPGYAVQVVDTCGSGDAFSAGFLHGYLHGEPLAECCRLGNALGALAATQPGATEPIPAERLGAFLQAPPPRLIDTTLARYTC